jgi:hypothetical protein
MRALLRRLFGCDHDWRSGVRFRSDGIYGYMARGRRCQRCRRFETESIEVLRGRRRAL